MRFKVSNKIRGTIVLPTIGYALKPGQMISVVGDQAEATDILTAVSRGFLEEYDDSLNVDDIIAQEEPAVEDNERLDLTKSQEIKLKFIEEEELPEEVDIEGKESNMMSYDMETQKVLDKDNSRKTALDRIGSEDAEPVQIGPIIDFDDDKPEEETEEPVVEEPKKIDLFKLAKKTKKKSKKSKKTKKSVKDKIDEVAAEVKKSIKPVGTKKEEPKTDNNLIYDNSEEVIFVDEEQTKEKIQKHPVLSKKDSEDH